MPDQKIQKALADAGVGSRRAVEALVADGRVQVNGRTASVGDRVDPGKDTIAVDGRVVPVGTPRVYLALAKPAGVTSTVSDRHAERTVLDAVPAELRPNAGRLYPIGRLDRDSEGLLLLTNDGDWANRVLHPRYGIEREYALGLASPLRPEQLRALTMGIELEEGTATLSALRPATSAEVAKLERSVGHSVSRGEGRLHWYRATLRQGWRRQLRRMLGAIGSPVERLIRVRIGTIWLGDMKLGEVRRLSASERARLEALAGAGERSARGVSTEQGGSSDQRTPDPASAAKDADPRLVVSLDGAASSGKSSVGSGAAAKLGYRFCDTGLLYRAITWLALEHGVDLDDVDALVALVPMVELVADPVGRLGSVRVAGVDVTSRIHTAQVDRHVSEVARRPEVREALLDAQRRLAEGGGIIMAGRDIGTVVLPDADVKIYLDVSLEERARRRAEDRGVDPESDEGRRIVAEMRRRDEVDSTRPTSPLRVPDGAEMIRSDGKRLEETIDAVVAAVRRTAARHA